MILNPSGLPSPPDYKKGPWLTHFTGKVHLAHSPVPSSPELVPSSLCTSLSFPLGSEEGFGPLAKGNAQHGLMSKYYPCDCLSGNFSSWSSLTLSYSPFPLRVRRSLSPSQLVKWTQTPSKTFKLVHHPLLPFSLGLFSWWSTMAGSPSPPLSGLISFRSDLCSRGVIQTALQY